MPRAVIFDMDGLLVDSEPVWKAVEREFARARGGDWPDELAHRCSGHGIANTLRVMHETYGFAVDMEADANAIVREVLARTGEMTLKPGARELVYNARVLASIALGSSSSRKMVSTVLQHFALEDEFETIVTGDDVPVPKPDPGIFLRCAERMGIAPRDCVVLEDAVAGAEAARAAGMRVLVVPEFEPARFVGLADVICTDLDDAWGHLLAMWDQAADLRG